MIRRFSLAASAMLALAGCTIAIVGISSDNVRGAVIGLVLVLTAGVFATIYHGSRIVP